MTNTNDFTIAQRTPAMLVHAFTASGAIFGILALYAVHQRNFIAVFWFLSASVLIDAVDGVMARRARTKVVTPGIDGALLDNLVDYMNYMIIPAFFFLVADMLPVGWGWRILGISLIVLSSSYQFVQSDAKTDDHFFKGFPSYWNIVVFYLFLWGTTAWVNLIVIITFTILTFVPIKYVYPSRMDYLSHNAWFRRGMLFATILWGVASAILLVIYPRTSPLLITFSIAYAILYMAVSIYRTLVPLKTA